MPDSMHVLQIVKPGQAEWQEAPIPELEAGEVLVKVEAITTCPHWDLHIMAGDPMFPGGKLDYPYPPGQPGHEMAGRVVQIGPGVTELSVGDAVAAWRDPGKVRMGCYAQYTPFRAEHLLPISESLTPAQVASLELAMCVQVAFDQLHDVGGVQGKRVGVGGLGSAGLIAVQMARIAGAAHVMGIDPLPARQILARQLGAQEAGPPGHPDGQDLDIAIDCTGLPLSVQALMARSRERVLLFGVLRESVAFGFDHWRRGLSLMGYGSHNRQAAGRALHQVTTGQLQLEPLATHELPLRDYAQGVELLRRQEAVKVRFLPWA